MPGLASTDAIGEEDYTTYRIGEETVSTDALGEEGPYTTIIVGEEAVEGASEDGGTDVRINPFGAF